MDEQIRGLSLKHRSKTDIKFLEELEKYFQNSKDSNLEKARTFAKFAPREHMTKFLARYEIFKKILEIPGSIVDCGVFAGQSLFTFAKLSSIFEPHNYQRKVYGFDTFSGFSKISKKDEKSKSEFLLEGGVSYSDFDDIQNAIKIFDLNRSISHIPKIEVIKGDVAETIPKFVDEHPEIVVSLLNIDMDLYEPAKVALEYLVPRMPKKSIIIFDELNNEYYKGETTAVREFFDLNGLEIKRLSFDASLSYTVI